MFGFFERLIEPFPVEDPSTPPTTVFAFCRHYSRGSEFFLFLVAFLGAAIAIIEVSLFGFLGELVDLLSNNTPDSLWQSAGDELMFMSGLVLIVLPLIVFTRSFLLFQTVLGNFPMAIRWQTHKYLLGQSMGFYQDEFAGRVATKVMQTSLAVRESILKLLDVLLYVSVYFISIVALVASLDWRLAIPFFIWLLAYAAILKFFLPRLKKIATKQAHARSDMTGKIVDTYTNINTVKLFSHNQRESDYAKSSMQGFLATVYPQMRLVNLLNISVWLINSLLIFSVTALAIWFWSLDVLTAGAIAAAVGLILRLYGMSQWAMWEVSSLFENLGIVRDGINTISQPRLVQDKKNSKPLEVSQGQIEFKQLSFRYTKDIAIFAGFNLNIKAGEKIGLVGRSGAGKSTLINLLLRFYDLESGQILIDGQDVSQVNQETIRSQVGVVTQDTSLLHRTVRENIVYGRPEATEAELIKAAKMAKADEFIQGLKDVNGNEAYDAQVGERGVKLSGGQRQRIAIARVLLKDAPILVLDEATSALDSEVESAIQENLHRLMQDKTVIAIAHRLSTIAEMDKLVVVDEGKIIEQGTHQELIAAGGVYAQLWARQSGGFIGDR